MRGETEIRDPCMKTGDSEENGCDKGDLSRRVCVYDEIHVIKAVGLITTTGT